MVTHETDDKLEKMRKGDALIRKARCDALEWLIAIDQILNAIIAEYLVKDDCNHIWVASIFSANDK